MKKLLTLASVAVVLIAPAAVAQDFGRLFIQPNATFATGAPATTNNDDSCDVGNAPAATLLLPFFSVDVSGAGGINTLFTLVNTTNMPQIAHVTVWTDWSFPVLDFNIFLTGYDVQGISLRDLLVAGGIDIPVTGYDVDQPITGTGDVGDEGLYSLDNLTGNPNFNDVEVQDPDTGCDVLPGDIPDDLQADVRTALTTGSYGAAFFGDACDELVGGVNATAQGYITVDVVDSCTQLLPTDPRYYTGDILWDNALTGDYQIVDVAGSFAGGESLVSIRAIPEGGNRLLGDPGVSFDFDTNFPFTFYDRYTISNPALGAAGIILSREIDRRMPLPGVWAARIIESEDVLGLNTRLQIWREGRIVGTTVAGGFVDCDVTDWSENGAIPSDLFVRFDEEENPAVTAPGVCQISPCPPGVAPSAFTTEEAERRDVSAAGAIPDFVPSRTAGGWVYMDLNGGCVADDSTTICSGRPAAESQAWVSSDFATVGSAFSTLFDATWLQNGCSSNPGDQPDPALPGFAPIGAAIAPSAANQGPNITPATP